MFEMKASEKICSAASQRDFPHIEANKTEPHPINSRASSSKGVVAGVEFVY